MDWYNIIFEKFHELENNVKHNYQDHIKGSIYQGERISQLAEWCCKNYEGDIIEIGAYIGTTTVLLAKVAKKYGRKVIVVDPYELGTQNCYGNEYEQFLNNTKEYKEYIDLFRESSITDSLRDKIKQRKLCFSFVDGLHTYDAAYFDMITVNHTHGIICLDDITSSTEVFKVIEIFRINNTQYNLIDTLKLTFRECYFISN